MACPLMRLDEFYDIARGGSPRPIKKFITDSEDGVNWIKIGDATASSKYIYETKQKITKEGVKKSRVVKEGDFILSNSMSFGRPYIMKTEGCIHDGWLVLSPRDDRIDQDFLYYLLGSPLVFKQFDNLAAGSTVRNLNIGLVSSVKIPLMSVEEQKRIVAILDEAFAQIDQAKANAEQNLKNARELFDSTLNQMFINYSSDWSVGVLGDVITVLTDYHANGSYKVLKEHVELKKSIDYAWMVRSTDFEKKFQNEKRYISESAYNYLAKSKLYSGDLIISKIGNAGKAYLMPETDSPCSLAMNLFLVRMDETKVLNKFVYHYLTSYSGYQQILSKLNGAATLTITKESVRSLKFSFPSLDKQLVIIKKFSLLKEQTQCLESIYKQKITALDELKQSLLQKAFSGELTNPSKGDAA